MLRLLARFRSLDLLGLSNLSASPARRSEHDGTPLHSTRAARAAPDEPPPGRVPPLLLQPLPIGTCFYDAQPSEVKLLDV